MSKSILILGIAMIAVGSVELCLVAYAIGRHLARF
jgi:hypothetical protein